MFESILPHSDLSQMLDNSLKRNPSALCRPYTVQIIQLVEGPPPPRRPIVDLAPSSSRSSSSYSSSEEEESVCSSYCSSEDPFEQLQKGQVPPSSPPIVEALSISEPSPETYSLRMKRILAWRENFNAQLSATIAEPLLKRKLQCDDLDYDYDALSRSSKRSRSQASSQGDDSVDSSLGEHPCPACDACFDSRNDLRQHGRKAGANEACFVAVEYAFE